MWVGRGVEARTKPVDGFVVFTYAFTSVADELGFVSFPRMATALV